jgi:hypothetical protein
LHRVGGPASLVRVGLTERDRAILDFERSWWQAPGPKGDAIADRLGLSPTGYYRRLNALLDEPEALALDPLLVRRLRRRRAELRRVRAEGPRRHPTRPARRHPGGHHGR